jgi:hypothetical protein
MVCSPCCKSIESKIHARVIVSNRTLSTARLPRVRHFTPMAPTINVNWQGYSQSLRARAVCSEPVVPKERLARHLQPPRDFFKTGFVARLGKILPTNPRRTQLE